MTGAYDYGMVKSLQGKVKLLEDENDRLQETLQEFQRERLDRINKSASEVEVTGVDPGSPEGSFSVNQRIDDTSEETEGDIPHT
jgi:hypothetical protein